MILPILECFFIMKILCCLIFSMMLRISSFVIRPDFCASDSTFSIALSTPSFSVEIRDCWALSFKFFNGKWAADKDLENKIEFGNTHLTLSSHVGTGAGHRK